MESSVESLETLPQEDKLSDNQPPFERRQFDAHFHALSEILSTVNAIRDDVNSIHDLKRDVEDLRETLNAHVEEETNMCRAAFPDGDPDGHRRAHEAAIRLAEERAEFWQRMRIKAGEMTVWAFLFCLASLVVYYWNGHVPAASQITMPK